MIPFVEEASGPAGMEPLASRMSSRTRLTAELFVAPIRNRSIPVVHVPFVRLAKGAPKALPSAATNASRTPLLPVPRFWWTPIT